MPLMIFLLGSSGYIGQAFKRHFNAQKVPLQEISALELMASGKEFLKAKIREFRPNFLINAAGFTGKPNVDSCELMKTETLAGNLILPIMLGEVCSDKQVPWGHVSSGCIYQGNRGSSVTGEVLGFREEDLPNFDFYHLPSSFYSGTKAISERLLEGFPRLYIWRLRVPFDERDGARNYITKLMRYPRLLDVRNSLSHRGDFVKACWDSYTRHLPYGVYNLTNHGSVTTREVVRLIKEEGQRRALKGDPFSSKKMDKSYEFFDSEAEFMEQAACTPRSSCVLDTGKALSAGLPIRDVSTALVESLQQWIWEGGA